MSRSDPFSLSEWKQNAEASAESMRAVWAEADEIEETIQRQTLEQSKNNPNRPIESARPLEWMDYATCKEVNYDVFFPSDGAGVEIAKAICRSCVVKEPCLEYALINGIDHGVWGGVSERQRRRIRRQRRLDAIQQQQK